MNQYIKTLDEFSIAFERESLAIYLNMLLGNKKPVGSLLKKRLYKKLQVNNLFMFRREREKYIKPPHETPECWARIKAFHELLEPTLTKNPPSSPEVCRLAKEMLDAYHDGKDQYLCEDAYHGTELAKWLNDIPGFEYIPNFTVIVMGYSISAIGDDVSRYSGGVFDYPSHYLPAIPCDPPFLEFQAPGVVSQNV